MWEGNKEIINIALFLNNLRSLLVSTFTPEFFFTMRSQTIAFKTSCHNIVGMLTVQVGIVPMLSSAMSARTRVEK